jgi:hypothetical protein
MLIVFYPKTSQFLQSFPLYNSYAIVVNAPAFLPYSRPQTLPKSSLLQIIVQFLVSCHADSNRILAKNQDFPPQTPQ